MTSSTPYESYFHVFRDINRSMHLSNSLQEVMDVVVTKSAEVLDAQGALLRIYDKKTDRFNVRSVCGLGEKYLSKGPVTTKSLLPDPSELHKVKIISDLWNAPRVEYPQEAWDEGIRLMVDIPLSIRNKLLGLIRIYLVHKRGFSDDELDFMLTIAEQCACIIERVQLAENQKEHFNHLAKQMDKMSSLGRMAAGIAHEINNPLTGILLFGSNMRKKVPPDGGLAEGLEIIIKETQRCKIIIQGLLDFARDNEPQRFYANINKIAESALGIVENEFHLRHVDIGLILDREMVDVLLDENQIEQVVINLLLNALHAVPENGRVSVKTSVDHDDNAVCIAVSDNGCGIEEANLKKIFEPFYSTASSGTGLGLSISYGIVKNHQGDIRVFSKPGDGARFVIALPIQMAGSHGKVFP